MSRFIFRNGGGTVITSDESIEAGPEDVVFDYTNNRMNPDHPDYGPLHTELVFDEDPCSAWDFCEMYPKSCEGCKYWGW